MKLLTEYLSGMTGLYNTLNALGFELGIFDGDGMSEAVEATRDNHTVIINGSYASYTGPLGNRLGLSFREMKKFLRNPTV